MTAPQQVDDLGPGDHACLTFTDPDERLDLVAAFVHAGLAAGHKVLCLTDAVPADRFPVELAAREVPAGEALARGQLEVRGIGQDWLHGRPDAGAMVRMLADRRDEAAVQGYPGLRVTADMCWATAPVAAADQLIAFEKQVATLFDDGGLCAICQYDRERFDAVTLAFAADVHPLAVTAAVYHEDPIVRICRQYRPPGLRIAGELDFTRAEPLTQAVAEAVRLDRDIHVNLLQLRYIDAACASVIVQAAHTLAADRLMTVHCHGLVHKMFHLVGAGDAARLRVRDADVQP